MPAHHGSLSRFKPDLSLALLAILLGTLWLAGGASRADALGQLIVRATAWGLLIVAALFGRRPVPVGTAPALLLLAVLLLALIQLIPLPPSLWQVLPGRSPFVEAAAASGQVQPWRPWSVVPGATINAAASLVVPLAVLVFVAGLQESTRRWLPDLLLVLVVASMLVGLLQFSGATFNNPLVNDTIGQVSGTFANRNHFALLLALGCLLAPVWAFRNDRQFGWRAPLALGLVLLFVLTILASGSRSGLVLGLLGLGLGLLLVRHRIVRLFGRSPRWLFPASVGVLLILILLSVVAGRAVSIDRILAVEAGQDMRSRGLPTILLMMRTYFPVGSGLGGFDPIFRLHEPFNLLKPTYFNHAHNDFLEVVLDAGLPGLAVLAGGLFWWAWTSLAAWRGGPTLPKLGSAMLLLIIIASGFDYPARTPMIMAVAMIAAIWLSDHAEERRGSALPRVDQHL